MIKVLIRIDTYHLGIELSTDRIKEEGHNMLIIIEMILVEEILGKCQITEVKILEVNIEGTIEMITLEEVEVGLGKDNIQVILKRMTEVVAVGQDHI